MPFEPDDTPPAPAEEEHPRRFKLSPEARIFLSTAGVVFLAVAAALTDPMLLLLLLMIPALLLARW